MADKTGEGPGKNKNVVLHETGHGGRVAAGGGGMSLLEPYVKGGWDGGRERMGRRERENDYTWDEVWGGKGIIRARRRRSRRVGARGGGDWLPGSA